MRRCASEAPTCRILGYANRMAKRVVAAIRVSRMRDESNSPAIQEDKARGWTALHDGTLVGLAVDTDVSGKTTSPWEREQLGPWLAHPERFDVLVASKLDRVCRNAMEFLQLVVWAKQHNVALVFVLDGIDLSTPGGELAAKILAVVAEWDWERIRENTLDGQQKAIQQGRFKGGVPPLGYRAVKDTRNGITGTWLVVDENERDFMRSLIERVVSGEESLSAICEDLNSRRIPTSSDRHNIRMGREPKGYQWHVATLRDLLVSRALLGEYRSRDASTLRDETGLPIAKAEPLITEQEFGELQHALEKISTGKILNRRGASMLQGVLFCGICNGVMNNPFWMYDDSVGEFLVPMWHTTRDKWTYYRCKNSRTCGNRLAKAPELEEWVSQAFQEAHEGDPMMEEVVIPGEDHSADIAALEERLTNLTGNLAVVKPGSSAAAATLKLLEDTETSLEALRALPSVPESVSYRDTGKTLTDVWRGLSDVERGSFLRNWGVRILWAKPAEAAEGMYSISWGYLDVATSAFRSSSSAK